MSLIINDRMGVTYAASLYRACAPSGNPWITFCVGTPPTDVQVMGWTNGSDSYVTSATTGSLVATGAVLTTTNTSTVLPITITTYQQTNRTFTATKAGTISWAVVSGYDYAVLDVGLPNSGAAIQVDTVNVSVGTTVTMQTLSFRVGI